MLNKKQKLFCDEYIVDLCATKAAIRAGYSKRTARSIGQENLTKPDIKKYIDDKLAEREEINSLTSDKVIAELSKGAFTNIDVSAMKYSDKLKCLEILAKYFGLLDGSVQRNKPEDKEAIKNRILEAVKRIGA